MTKIVGKRVSEWMSVYLSIENSTQFRFVWIGFRLIYLDSIDLKLVSSVRVTQFSLSIDNYIVLFIIKHKSNKIKSWSISEIYNVWKLNNKLNRNVTWLNDTMHSLSSSVWHIFVSYFSQLYSLHLVHLFNQAYIVSQTEFILTMTTSKCIEFKWL